MAKKQTDTQTLSAFKRESAAAIVKKLKRTGRPLTLTVDGEPSLVLLDAATYRELAAKAESVEEAEMRAFLERSMADIDAGRTRDAFVVMDELVAKYKLPKVS